jgi:outer membrane protein W
MKIRLFQSILALLILVSATAQAQKNAKDAKNTDRITFGAHAGVNFQNITGKDPLGIALTNAMTPRFNAGVDAQIPLAEAFSIQVGVTFAQKGAKSTAGTVTKTALSYVEVPITFVYKPEIGDGNLIVGFGPYFGYGVAGKTTFSNGTTSNVKFKNTVTLTDVLAGIGYVKGLDAGANFVVGYQLSSNISLALKAQLGLVNISPKYDALPNDKASLSNVGYGLSVGYRF